MATYLTPAQLPLFYDLRRVLELSSDDPSDPAVEADLSDTASSAYLKINNCIFSAESEIDSHCQQGKRYTRANLELIVTAATAAPSDTALRKRAAKLKQLTADLAYGLLISRRGMNTERVLTLAPRYEAAQVALEQLSLGVTVFDLDENINAGVPSSATIGLNVYRPSFNNPMFGTWSDRPGDGNYFGRW